MKTVKYYFDFLSPFSYLSWQRSGPIRRNPEIRFEFRPVMMTNLFGHFGIKAPGEVAPKREFMLKQCFRLAHKNQIVFNPPVKHPFNPLYVLRMATLAASGEQQEQVIDALWQLTWSQGIDGGDPEALEGGLNSLGLNGKQLMENSFLIEAKKELKANTQMAIEQRVFGVPTWITEDELFWGNDSLEDLSNFLSGTDIWDRLGHQKAISNNPLN